MVKSKSSKLVAPLIILSSPRAGSTLLFETLAKHPQLWSIGGESHALIEHVPALSTVARGYVSNRLGKDDATDDVVETLRERFLKSARNVHGILYHPENGSIRLLEKTPKNALRVEFFNQVFPDAKFVHLVRDPRENISSIMQAWRSNRFVTYPNIANTGKHWSLLLPDGWQRVIDQSLATIARYQWQQANDRIIDGLEGISDDRKMIMTYRDFVADPSHWVTQIAKFANLSLTPISQMLSSGLALSRFTLTAPKPDKWRLNIDDIRPELSYLHNTLVRINQNLHKSGIEPVEGLVDDSIRPVSITSVAQSVGSRDGAQEGKVSRNAPCPCGSGKKYRNCHGALN